MEIADSPSGYSPQEQKNALSVPFSLSRALKGIMLNIIFCTGTCLEGLPI